ncbi:MAG: hypothetical protein NUW12_08930 [Firmicutes bacterium]|nr:hypothetical protein [Bacillota bacterium]MDH7496033.1 hypothetical protein [Bacillota bacterium]
MKLTLAAMARATRADAEQVARWGPTRTSRRLVRVAAFAWGREHVRARTKAGGLG